jgi:hypothetical protein
VVAHDLETAGDKATQAGSECSAAAKDVQTNASKITGTAGETVSGQLVAAIAPDWGPSVDQLGTAQTKYGTALRHAATDYRKNDKTVQQGASSSMCTDTGCGWSPRPGRG